MIRAAPARGLCGHVDRQSLYSALPNAVRSRTDPIWRSTRAGSPVARFCTQQKRNNRNHRRPAARERSTVAVAGRAGHPRGWGPARTDDDPNSAPPPDSRRRARPDVSETCGSDGLSAAAAGNRVSCNLNDLQGPLGTDLSSAHMYFQDCSA